MVQPRVCSLGEEHLSSFTPSPIYIFCIFSTTTVLQNPGKAHLWGGEVAPGFPWHRRNLESSCQHFHTQL